MVKAGDYLSSDMLRKRLSDNRLLILGHDYDYDYIAMCNQLHMYNRLRLQS